MLDPLTAFGLAANILQVVDISFKAIAQCREVYKDGSLAEHRHATDITAALAHSSNQLKATRTQAATPRSQDDLGIIDLATKCSKVAEDLLTELEKLRLDQSGLRQAITKSVRAMRRKGVLKEKQELLEKYRRVLDTRILIRLDARALKETQDMQDLDQSVQGLVFAIEKGQNTVEELMVTQSLQIKDHIDSVLESRSRGSEDAIARQRLLEGLFYPEIVSREEQIPEAFRGTCGWIFDSAADERSKYRPWANFRSWLETEDGVYWISGKPGSGKSTLMKYIVNEDSTTRLLSDWKRGTDLVVISFFFWNAGTALQKSCTGLLRSLLYQVATQWPGLAYLVSAQHGKSTREVEVSDEFHLFAAWTDQRLLSLLSLFLDQKPDSLSVCAFVDGLDEFVGDEDLLLDMIRLFRETSKCKICVSSRPEQAFRQEFRRCPQLRVQDLNREDIKRMATGKLLPSLRRHKNLPQDSDDAKWLVHSLIEKASGVFLWLDLMIKDLIRGLRNHDTLGQLKSRLDRTPDTINGVYAHMIQSLDPLYSEESAKYFRALLAAVDSEFDTTLQRLVCAEGEPWVHLTQLDFHYFTTPHFKSACQSLAIRLVSCCGGFIEIQDDKEDEEAEDEDVEDEDMEDEDVEDGDVEDEEVEDEDVEDEDVEDGDVEDEEVEDEDVEDEEVEDEDVEDEEAEIEVLKEAAFISRHNRNVDFVHRTAVEYIREKYDITGPDSSSLVEAKAQIARAHIGSLALFRLFPFRYSQGARHGNNRLFWLLKDTMTAILALGSHAIMTGVDVSIQSVQVDLTDQAIQTFRNPVLFDCFAEQNFINEVSLLRLQCIYECGLIQDDLADLVSWCLKSDRLLVAAFFGCNHYVQRRMSTDNVSRERNIILLEVALAGFNYSVNNRDSVSRRGFHHSFLRFLIIQALLKHDLDPNKPCPLARPQWWCEQYGTLWGMFFVLLIDATQISLLYGIPATDRLPWATLCTDLITKFLSLGANPNARVGLNHGFISRNDKSYHFYSEQSLLALWECVRPETAQILPTIGARLQSAGGFHDREFRIMEHEDSFYPVSHFQSQRLNEAVRSGLTEEASSHYLRVAYRMRYLTEFSGEVFTEIVTSIMAEAPIDEEEAISMMPLKLPEESF